MNRSDFTASSTGLRFTNSALSYLNTLANQNRVELEGIGSFTDRYSPVQSISGNMITMQQPAWNNNNFGYDTITEPVPRGPDVPGERLRVPRLAPVSGTSTPRTGILYYIPRSGQNMSSADVELPALQSLVDVGGTYDSPAHNVSFSGITFTGTSWLRPSSNQGYADQQTGAYISGNWSWPGVRTPAASAAPQFEATRPHWNQMPAAVQVSAANNITFSGDQFVNLGQTALGIGNDANAHASGVGLGASSITVTGSTFTARLRGRRSWPAAYRPTRTTPATPRMINRNITISNNLVHDMGLDYRGITSFLPTYVTNATDLPQRDLQHAVLRHRGRLRLGRQRRRRQQRLRQPRPVQLPAPLHHRHHRVRTTRSPATTSTTSCSR